MLQKILKQQTILFLQKLFIDYQSFNLANTWCREGLSFHHLGSEYSDNNVDHIDLVDACRGFMFACGCWQGFQAAYVLIEKSKGLRSGVLGHQILYRQNLMRLLDNHFWGC